MTETAHKTTPEEFFMSEEKYLNLAQNLLGVIDLNDDDPIKKNFIQKKLFEEYKPLLASKTEKYSQDWTAYNQAQQKGKLLLIQILDELLSQIPYEEKTTVGRKPLTLREKIFGIVLQAYNAKSSRRAVADLEICKQLGYVSKSQHFNSILKSLNDQSLTPVLKLLVESSGLPLRCVESSFAVDSSGFSTSLFGRWLDVRASSDSKKRKYVKAHICVGVKTNVITSVEITKGSGADCPELIDLVERTSQNFELKEVSADKAYNSRDNFQAIHELGAIPFIPFKKNSTGKAKGSMIYRKMYLFFIQFQDEFGHHYHKRSNVESVFSMIKRKFGTHLRSKSEVSQTNEILVRCLCHNLCVLIQESFELGIDLDMNLCASAFSAHK